MQCTIEAETRLVATLLPRLRRRARRLLSDPAEADDIVQDALMRLLEVNRRNSIRTPEPYAMIILHNLARQRWRARHETHTLEDDIATTQPTGTARLVCGEIASAIERLPPDQADLMRKVMHGETSPRLLAAAADCPLGTVMSRLARARVTLRAQMGMNPEVSVTDLL